MPRSLRVLALVALVLAGALVAAPALGGPLDDGKKALEARDWSAAADAFRKVLAKKPSDPDAALGLARALIGGGASDGFPDAETALHAAIEANPGRRDLRHALGDLYLATAKTKVANPQAMKFILEDAKTTFQTLLEEDPKDEEAAVGYARALYESADFEGALAALDDFIEKGESAGKAWYWRGQVYYLQALDAYRNAGQVDETAKGLFGKASGAYMTAARLDPQDFDAWMQYGYASQYLGDTAAAREAYEKAMDLDLHSMAPLKGIEALFYYEQDKYPDALRQLAASHPDNVAVHFYVGFNALQRGQYDDALRALEAYAKRSKTPGFAWVHIARAYEGKGNDAEAQRHYRKALEYNPADVVAADGIDKALRAEHGGQAGASPQKAMAMAKAYDELFALAPQNVYVRNNVAFILREAVTRRQGDPAWRPVLDRCTAIYEDASRLVDEQMAGRAAATPYTTRHAYAGVLNDTGLMFQYYPAIRDLERAEDYYNRALDLTQDGYYDAFDNLRKIYQEQGRMDDLEQLAEAAAEGLKQADGSPNATGRAQARGILQQLSGR